MSKMLVGFLKHFVGLGRGGAVGAFGHQLHIRLDIFLTVSPVDLAFDRRGDQHIGFLGDPGIAVFDDITRLPAPWPCRSCRIDPRWRAGSAGSMPPCLAVGIRLLVMAVVAGDAGDLAAQHARRNRWPHIATRCQSLGWPPTHLVGIHLEVLQAPRARCRSRRSRWLRCAPANRRRPGACR